MPDNDSTRQDWSVQPTHIQVEAEVRYWEDATVNGVTEDNDAPTIPLRRGDAWCPSIRLSDGVVEDWPEGVTAAIHYKVCDQGSYWLTDASGNLLMQWAGSYVPDDVLCPTGQGFGDYIIMNIDQRGHIAGWSKPAIDPERWTRLTQAGEGARA